MRRVAEMGEAKGGALVESRRKLMNAAPFMVRICLEAGLRIALLRLSGSNDILMYVGRIEFLFGKTGRASDVFWTGSD